jgi:hypothetical protein
MIPILKCNLWRCLAVFPRHKCRVMLCISGHSRGSSPHGFRLSCVCVCVCVCFWGGGRSTKTSSTSRIWRCGLDVWLTVGNFGKQVGGISSLATDNIFWTLLLRGSLLILFSSLCALWQWAMLPTVRGACYLHSAWREGGAKEREKQLVFGPEWDSWIFWRPRTNVKVLFFPMRPGIKRIIALSEDSQTLLDCRFDQNSINMKMRMDCHLGGPILMKGQSMWDRW